MDALFWTVVAFVLGFGTNAFFLWLANRDRVPSYAIAYDRILKQRLPKLRLHYHGYGEDLNDVSVSYVAFWNAGRGLIDKASVATKDPIRVSVDDKAKIIDAIVFKRSREITGLTCAVANSREHATLTFDFLDYQVGAVICLVHTGDHITNVEVAGTIKGTGANGLRHRHFNWNTRPDHDEARARAITRVLNSILVLMVALLLGLAATAAVTANDKLGKLLTNDKEREIAGLSAILAVLVCLAVAGLAVPYFRFLNRMKPPKLPPSLREYDRLF